MSPGRPCGRAPVVVLGAGGYLGRSLSARLVGHRAVRLVSRRPPGGVTAEPRAEVELVGTDLGAAGTVEAVVEDAAAVVHLVHSPHPRLGWRAGDPVGRALLERVLQACPSGVPVLLASTVRTSATGPPSTYQADKREAERLLEQASAAGRVLGVALRLPTLYGVDTSVRGVVDPGRGIVASMVARALASEDLQLWDRGTVRRNLLHVSDAARAFEVALLEATSLSGGVLDVCGEDTLEVAEVFGDIAREVARATGQRPVRVRGGDAPEHATGEDAADVLVDPAAFRRLTGWRPVVPWSPGLRATVSEVMAKMGTASRGNEE